MHPAKDSPELRQSLPASDSLSPELTPNDSSATGHGVNFGSPPEQVLETVESSLNEKQPSASDSDLALAHLESCETRPVEYVRSDTDDLAEISQKASSAPQLNPLSDHHHTERQWIQVDCPKCGRMKHVFISQLCYIQNCDGCGNSFAVRASGQVSLKKKRFPCPRCHESILVLEHTDTSALHCPSCRLPITIPSHGSPGHRSKPGRSHNPAAGTDSHFWMRLRLSPHCWVGVIGFPICFGVLFVFVWWLLIPEIDPKLKQATQALFAAIMGGDDKTVYQFVPPDQTADYRFWIRRIVKPTLAQSPVHGGAALSLRLDRRDPPLTWLRLSLQTRDGETVSFLLAWQQKLDGSWQLDARETARAGPQTDRNTEHSIRATRKR